VIPRVRFLYPEPVIHVVAPPDRPDLAADAAGYNESQFEVWDMIAGRKDPFLGGAEHYLDIVGLNYYHSNQWEHPAGRLRWEDEPRDPRWVPFHQLIAANWKRYQKPLMVSETSHFGSGRSRWIREMTQEVYHARLLGIPVEGICLYPILDRYDWENKQHWHNSGLWDMSPGDPSLRRVINVEYAAALRESQQLLATIGCR
jgi:UDP-galactopyranose mutase